MVAVLFLVGRHLEPVQIVNDLLDTNSISAKPVYEMASEIPLVLFDCGFEDVRWEYNDDAHRKLLAHFESARNELSLKSAVVALMFDASRAAYPSSVDSKCGYPVSTSTSFLFPYKIKILYALNPFFPFFDCFCTPQYVPLLQRVREESLEVRLRKHQARQTKKKPRTDDVD